MDQIGKKGNNMNIFGTFDFGRLIKTFLPGFILFLSICIYLDCISILTVNTPFILPFANKNLGAFGIFSIPFSIILGTVSNTIFFSLLTPWLIDRNFHKMNPNYCQLESAFKDWVLEHYAECLKDRINIDNFKAVADVGALLLPNTDLKALSIVSEGFWFYMEFQLNILFAITFSMSAILLMGVVASISVAKITFAKVVIAFLLLLGIYIILAIILIKAARLNYRYYQTKTLSLRILALLNSAEKPKVKEGE